MTLAEGVIKFHALHAETAAVSDAPLVPKNTLLALCAWRRVLFQLGLIGADPSRYGGAGFGNVSMRVPPYLAPPGRRAFLVSATQTGALQTLASEHWTHVDSYDIGANRVTSRGPSLPSSEAMTHGAIYDSSPHIRVVLHVHAPALWRSASALGLCETGADIDYGTPEMAREIARLWRHGVFKAPPIVAMRGHEDGVIAFGHDADEAGRLLVGALARAYALA